MKLVRQYWLVLIIFLLVVIVVLLRSFSRHDFRYDAVRWAEPSLNGSNVIAEDQLTKPGSDILIISLGESTGMNDQLKERATMIDPESILEKETLSLIRKNKGPVILCSDDSSVSARVWMVLSQMGIQNIYVTDGEHDEELAK